MNTILLSLYIALRLHRNSKKNKMISFISIISIGGNSLSIAILITCLSEINGFKNELNERLFAIIPHGNIQSIDSKFYNWNIVLEQINKIPDIKQTTPYINFSALIEKNNKFHPIQIHGINSLYNMHPHIMTYLSSNDAPKYFYQNKQLIILGKGAADALNIQKNDWINIIIHNSNFNNNKLLPYKQINIHVIDILNLNSYLDHNLAIIPLLDAQNYLNRPGDISGINIKVNNIFHIDKVLNKIKKIINNDHIITQSWIKIYKYIYQDICIIKIIIYLIMILVICIASFSIVSILTLIIKEKNHDLIILNALGSKKHLMYSIFTWYGLLNSLTSITIGGITGTLISLHLTYICNIIKDIFQYEILTQDAYFINFLPTELHIQDIIITCSINLFLNLTATLYSIIKSEHINHSTILK